MTSERIYNKAINPYFILLHLDPRFARTYRNHGEALKSLITNSDRNILLVGPDDISRTSERGKVSKVTRSRSTRDRDFRRKFRSVNFMKENLATVSAGAICIRYFFADKKAI